MKRPTIADVATRAGVSVATVNRVLGRSERVRYGTLQKVLAAARVLGFHIAPVMDDRLAHAQAALRLGLIVQTPHRHFSDPLERAIRQAALDDAPGHVAMISEHLDDLSPESMAQHMRELGAQCQVLVVLALEHPLVVDVVDQLSEQGVHVLALASPLAARHNVAYVGTDAWKMGRTAAWALHHGGLSEGPVGILLGTHRFRCHDMYEGGFRSYMREHLPQVTVLEALSTLESDSIGHEVTERLLQSHPDLRGLYVPGGGITGALTALRAAAPAQRVQCVGHELLPATRSALLDGTLLMVFAHPFEAMARATVTLARHLVGGKAATSNSAPVLTAPNSVMLPFEIYTSENL